MDGLVQKNQLLSHKNDEYLDLIKKRAEAERVYNMAVAEKTMRLKMDGMAIGMIDKLVRGDATVSGLKLKLDVAEGVERACLNGIKDLRSAVDTYRSLLAWLKAEMQAQ